MKKSITIPLSLVVMLTVFLAACVPDGQPSSTPTVIENPTPTEIPEGSVETYPDPEGGTIYFPRQPPGVDHMQALLSGTLMLDQQGCLRVEGEDGFSTLIMWHHDFSLQIEGDAIEVLNGEGQVVGRVGESITMGGGETSAAVVPGLPESACTGPFWALGEIEPLAEQTGYMDYQLCYAVAAPPDWTVDGVPGAFANFHPPGGGRVNVTNVALNEGFTLQNALEHLNQGSLGPYVEEVTDYILDGRSALWVTFSEGAEFQSVVLAIAPDCGFGEHALFLSFKDGYRATFEEFLSQVRFQGEPELMEEAPVSQPLSGRVTPVPLENSQQIARSAQLGGSIHGIASVGDFAYVGLGPRVAAIDLSQVKNPRLVLQSPPLPGQVTHLLPLSTDVTLRLLVGAGRYLFVLDMAVPERLEPIYQILLPGAISAMVLDPSTGILYLGGAIYREPYQYSGFITSVSIGPDAGLTLLQTMALPAPPLSITIGNGVVYAGTEGDEGGLYGMHLSTPGALSLPRKLISFSSSNPITPYSLQVTGDRLYMGSYGGFHAFDIQDPIRPEQVWKESLDMMVMGFKLNGDHIDVFGWLPAGGYLPTLASFLPPESMTGTSFGETASITAVHNGDFLVAYRNLEIYRRDNQWDLSLASVYQPPVISVMGAAIGDGAVYILDQGVGDGRSPAILRAFNLPGLETIGQVMTEVPDHPGWFSGLAVEADRAYVATPSGLWIYDLSSPTLTLLSQQAFEDEWILAISGIQLDNRRLLFISKEVSELSVLTAYDLTDPGRPVRIGDPLYLDRGRIHQMVWSGSALYALLSSTRDEGGDRLYVVDFDQHALVLRDSLELPGRIFSLSADGELVALAGIDGLSIISTELSGFLQPLAQVSLPEPGMQVSLQEGRALVVLGGRAAQLWVFDLQNPANPTPVEAIDVAFGNNRIGSMPVSETYLLLASGSSGVDVMEIKDQD